MECDSHTTNRHEGEGRMGRCTVVVDLRFAAFFLWITAFNFLQISMFQFRRFSSDERNRGKGVGVFSSASHLSLLYPSLTSAISAVHVFQLNRLKTKFSRPHDREACKNWTEERGVCGVSVGERGWRRGVGFNGPLQLTSFCPHDWNLQFLWSLCSACPILLLSKLPRRFFLLVLSFSCPRLVFYRRMSCMENQNSIEGKTYNFLIFAQLFVWKEICLCLWCLRPSGHLLA